MRGTASPSGSAAAAQHSVLSTQHWQSPVVPLDRWLLAEAPCRYILEVRPADMAKVAAALAAVPWTLLGVTAETNEPLTVQGVEKAPVRLEVEALRHAWTKTLDW